MINLFKTIGCLFSRHDWTNSHKKRGMMTCKKCGLRRKWR